MRILSLGLKDEVLPSLRTAAKSVAGEAASIDIETRIEPASDKLRAILETYDAVALPLSLPRFTALHLAEYAHRMNARARLILISRAELGREQLELVFDFYLPATTFTDSELQEVLQEIRDGRPRLPLGPKLVEAIEGIVTRAHCFVHKTDPGMRWHPSEAVYATMHDYRREANSANQEVAELARDAVNHREPGDRRFDFAVSYASADRDVAEKLAGYLTSQGCVVFFDPSYASELAGRELGGQLDEIFRKGARYCIILVSRPYVESKWTAHERRSAIARQTEEEGREYILPIRIDETELPDLPGTIAYLSLRDGRVETIADTLIQKLQVRRSAEM